LAERKPAKPAKAAASRAKPARGTAKAARPPVSVVLPVHNEVGAIEGVLRGFHAAVAARMPGAEILVAEDGSTDGTKELLARLQGEVPFRLVSGAERKGYLRGVRDAVLAASGDWVFYCDTDGTHDPEDFWTLWEARGDADVVAGYKLRRQDPAYRKAASRAYNRLVGWRFGFRVRDSNAGFKLLRREVVEAVVPRVRHLKLGFSTELLARAHGAGFRIVQVPVRHFPRTTGRADQFPVARLPRIAWAMWAGMTRVKRDIRAADRGGRDGR
jgi:glycosyltransferase involved in cell wall biosynthesis